MAVQLGGDKKGEAKVDNDVVKSILTGLSTEFQMENTGDGGPIKTKISEPKKSRREDEAHVMEVDRTRA